MTRLLKCFVAVLLTVALSAGAVTGSLAQGQFVGGTDDLPLMPGLTEVPDQDVVFETPQGRIVETVATGVPSQAQVIEFYDRALPQLGWEKTGQGTYRREGEALTLEFESDGPSVVRFRLKPAH